MNEEHPVRSRSTTPTAPSTGEAPTIAVGGRWLPLVKWFLAIPHYIALFFLYLAAIVVVIVAWFAILLTGRYPRGIFDFVEGVVRWHNRVVGYAFILVTDRYPPFSLSQREVPPPTSESPVEPRA